MANPKKRVPENVAGDFFVDSTCIDCDTCRQIAPAVFGEATATSFVESQPVSSTDRRHALQALLACPTGSIGCMGDDDVKAVMQDFPLLIEEPVYYCGYNSPKSYGGNSYFIRHPAGNWLIDSPKFVAPLVKQLEAFGGIAHIFLTHRDDVADADRYAEHFGSRRIIHRDELSSQPGAEMVLDGKGPWELAPGFLAIPTPGHTKGHCVLLVENRFLFTGDHLDWDRDAKRLAASESYCWYSWPQQADSMARLAEYQFEWVLPGHGQKVYLPADEMREQILLGRDDAEKERVVRKMAKAKMPNDIDAYVSQFPADVQAILQNVRETIRLAAPECSMNICKFGGLMPFAVGIVGLVAFAQEGQSQENKMDHMEHNTMMQACAKACSDCQRACDSCATHFAHLLTEGKKEHMKSLATVRIVRPSVPQLLRSFHGAGRIPH